MYIPDIVGTIAVFFNLAKKNKERNKSPHLQDASGNVLTYQIFCHTQDSAVTWLEHPILTKSMRSLRFFSICCGGRRLIKSKAQSSCWSLCRNKNIPVTICTGNESHSQTHSRTAVLAGSPDRRDTVSSSRHVWY